MSREGLGNGYGCRHPRHHGRWSISQGGPRLPSFQILTLEADAVEHLLIYFYYLRHVLQVLLKPLLPSHTSSCGLSESSVSVHARNNVSELLWHRCLCRFISLFMAGNCLNEDHKGILMLPAAAKCFMALLRAFSKLLPATWLGRQRGAGEKKFNFHARWFFFMSAVVHTLSKGQGHTVVAAVVICFGECWKLPHSSLAILFPKTWKCSKKRRTFKDKLLKTKTPAFLLAQLWHLDSGI